MIGGNVSINPDLVTSDERPVKTDVEFTSLKTFSSNAVMAQRVVLRLAMNQDPISEKSSKLHRMVKSKAQPTLISSHLSALPTPATAESPSNQ